MALMVLGGVSCQKEATPVAAESVALYTHPGDKPEPAEAGSRAVTVLATVDGWTATPTVDWITVTPAPGHDYTRGVREVILYYTENTTGAQRSGDVVFQAGSYGETYTLTQAAAQ